MAVPCIFCGNELGPDTKPEHVLLNALGGRKTARRVICSECNNYFGGTIDAALAEQVEVIRNLLQLNSGTGKPPPMLRDVQAGAEKVIFRNDGRPELVMPPFTVTEDSNGNAGVQIAVRSVDELLRALPHLAARLGVFEAELIEKMEGATGAFVEKRPGLVHHSLSLGGEKALRSIAKSCLVLLATLIGNEAVQSDAFKAARAFVLTGGAAFAKGRVKIDSRDIPGADVLSRDYGRVFNLIYLRSDPAGRVIGHFTLYNIVGWQIILAEAGGPPDLKAGLVSNPEKAADWSDAIAAAVDNPFEWLDVAEKAYALERARERMISLMQKYLEDSRKVEIGRIVDESFARHGIQGNGEPIDPTRQNAILNEIAARIAAFALGQAYERALTREEIAELLKGRSED